MNFLPEAGGLGTFFAAAAGRVGAGAGRDLWEGPDPWNRINAPRSALSDRIRRTSPLDCNESMTQIPPEKGYPA